MNPAATSQQTKLTAKLLQELLEYDPDTGVFTWKKRAVKHFQNERHANIWNAKHAGKRAGWIAVRRTRNTDYRVIEILGRNYPAHRLAWLSIHGVWPPGEIDHRDGNGLNNQLANLRVATRAENARNMGTRKNNTSGLKGVHWDKAREKWLAQIMVKGRHIYLGRFDTAQAAHLVYLEAAKHHFGEFACA